ncbi:unnamed protein product [Prorocentrum cordatum]|uniref:Uncharacterized protein n=1 Tax=Prorocentrum cordatum TaxID=2364126 RepID=A0ABN9QSD5_9DINO|nr:unnamed protein product [Polarella glacialis]
MSPAKARPKADKDGWVDQPRGRRAQRQARSAASRGASAKSQTSASAAIEQLEALQAEPPDGVDGCFTDVVASQLGAKRAELVRAHKAAAEQKASSLPRAAQLHRAANAISRGGKRLRAARLELEQKQAARSLVEAQLQKAQEELAELDAEVEGASRALLAMRRQRAAEWAGASQVPGLLMQLEKLPEAWGSSNFEVAWAAIRTQVEAVQAQLAGAPVVAVAPGSHSQPQSEAKLSGVARHASGSWLQRQRTWLLWLLVMLAAPLGAALEERSQGQRVPRETSAAGLRQHECGRADSALVEPHGIDVSDPPRYLGHAAGPSIVLMPQGAEQNEVGAHVIGTSEWSDPIGQAGVPGHPEAMAMSADLQQPAELPLRVRARRLEAVAARRARAATAVRCASPADAVVRSLERFGWCVESERRMVVDLGDEFDPVFLGPRARSFEASSVALQASNRHERQKLSCDPLLLRLLFGDAIGQLLGPGIELYVKGQHVRGAYISNAHWTMRVWRLRQPVDGRLNGKLYLDGSAKSSEGCWPLRLRSLLWLERRPLLESSRSTGSSAAALSATAVAFSILGHALSYACAGEGEDAQEIVACSKRGAHKVLGSHAGGKSRLKVQCPGPSYLTNKSGRNQRSLWGRGLHPGGRPRAGKQRVKGEGIPALRSQGPAPGHAQERYLKWLGMEAEPAGKASAAASSSGSGPAAPAAALAAEEAAAASLPQQRPGLTSAGPLGANEATEEVSAAAGAAASDGQMSRRVRRRLARRGLESESE